METESARVGWVPRVVGTTGAWIIYGLIWLFGRTRRRSDVPWLAGPVGGDVIGDAPFQDVAASEGLTIERTSRDGGLVLDFAMLAGTADGGFDPAGLQPLVREFVRDGCVEPAVLSDQPRAEAAGDDDQPAGQPAQL